MRSYPGDPRWIVTRYAGTCANCAAPIGKGEHAFFYPTTRDLYCRKLRCGGTEAADFISHAMDEDAYHGQGGPYAR